MDLQTAIRNKERELNTLKEAARLTSLSREVKTPLAELTKRGATRVRGANNASANSSASARKTFPHKVEMVRLVLAEASGPLHTRAISAEIVKRWGLALAPRTIANYISMSPAGFVKTDKSTFTVQNAQTVAA